MLPAEEVGWQQPHDQQRCADRDQRDCDDKRTLLGMPKSGYWSPAGLSRPHDIECVIYHLVYTCGSHRAHRAFSSLKVGHQQQNTQHNE